MTPHTDYRKLVTDEGRTNGDGKVWWKDFVTVQVTDHKLAMELAIDILKQLQTKDPSIPITFNLAGTLYECDE